MNETTTAQSQQPLVEAEPTSEAPLFQPRFDIVETDNELTLYGDLPGIDQASLDVRYENEQLIIHGQVPPRHEGVKFIHQEFGVGDFHRTFSIGIGVEADAITAEMKDGVLILHLPKSSEAKPKRIKVKSL